MAVIAEEILEKHLTKKQIAEARKKSAKDMAAYKSLQAFRKAQKKTQVELAKKLDVSQQAVTNLENRSDMLVSTLRKYVEGNDGKLRIIVDFDDRDPIEIESLVLDTPEAPKKPRGKWTKFKRNPATGQFRTDKVSKSLAASALPQAKAKKKKSAKATKGQGRKRNAG